MNRFDNPQLDSYFQSLPKMIQESIKQTDVKFYTVEELKAFAQKLMQK